MSKHSKISSITELKSFIELPLNEIKLLAGKRFNRKAKSPTITIKLLLEEPNVVKKAILDAARTSFVSDFILMNYILRIKDLIDDLENTKLTELDSDNTSDSI